MKRHYLQFIFSCVLLSSPAFADESVMQPRSQGDVTFISGGVGIEEREALDAARPNYNLSLLFSEQSGDYLSDVMVRITDLNNNVFLEPVAVGGPKLFAKLPPGRYIVTAEAKGQSLQKTVTVKNNHQPAVSFVWH